MMVEKWVVLGVCNAGRGESERRSASDRRNRGPQKSQRRQDGTKVSIGAFSDRET